METCVKNCGHRFHIPVCKQEFVKELVKIIQPNMNPPTVVQEKILSIIQSWADAFRSKPDLQGVVKVYEELKQKGIEFPATNLDELSPIVTPQRVSGSLFTPSIPRCQGRVVKFIKFKFWWLSHQSVGSYPCLDTCVIGHDALTYSNCLYSLRNSSGTCILLL